MGLEALISPIVKNTAKSLVNFDLAIDPLLDQLQKGCPSKTELDKILAKKNQMSQALTQVQKGLTTLTDTSTTLEGILTGADIAVKVIKALPIPTSVPPGVGIPLNVINGFSSALIKLADLIKAGKVTVAQITPATKIMTTSIAKIQDKLSKLDGLLANCLVEQADSSLLWSSTKDYVVNDQVYLVNPEGGKDYYKALESNLNKSPDQNSTIWETSDEDSAKTSYFASLGINLNTENVDETSLNANSNDPFFYKGYKIVLDTNANNKFSFPERRGIATNDTGEKVVGPWSYSASTQVLLDGVKFEIDKIDKLALRAADEAAAAEAARLKLEQERQAALDKAYKQGEQTAKNYGRVTDNPYNKTDLRYNSWLKGYNDNKIVIKETVQSSPQTGMSSNIANASTNVANTSTPPPPTYMPFGYPAEDKEVKARSGKLWQYSVPQKKWNEFFPNYAPFTTKGGFDGQTNQITYRNVFPMKRMNYKWSQKFYKWEYVSTETL